jgi:hypothetical protein
VAPVKQWLDTVALSTARRGELIRRTLLGALEATGPRLEAWPGRLRSSRPRPRPWPVPSAPPTGPRWPMCRPNPRRIGAARPRLRRLARAGGQWRTAPGDRRRGRSAPAPAAADRPPSRPGASKGPSPPRWPRSVTEADLLAAQRCQSGRGASTGPGGRCSRPTRRSGRPEGREFADGRPTIWSPDGRTALRELARARRHPAESVAAAATVASRAPTRR